MIKAIRLKEVLSLKKSKCPIPRKHYKKEKPAIVSKAKTITEALKKVNGLSDIKKGDAVLIKPNMNSDDAFPGTTRPEGLRELIKLLKKKGAKITVGDMSGILWARTEKIGDKIGITKVCEEEKVPMAHFDDTKWIKFPLPNTSLKYAWITEEICNHDHLINLCVLKTHRMDDFTLSMKNLMGVLHMRTRLKMHTDKLKQRTGEFQPVVTPCINIVDGTKCFIEGGPDKGKVYNSKIVLASRDRIALDTTCVDLLKSFGSKSLKNIDPWLHPQITYAIQAGIGISRKQDVKII